MQTVKGNVAAVVVDSEENGLEVNVDKTKYMVMSGDQNEGWSHNIKIDNTSFGRAKEFKYFWKNLAQKKCIQEEIKSRLKSRNACYHLVQNVLCSSLLFKNIKIKIYRTVMLRVVLYGCETWSLTLREGCRLRVFENRVLRGVFGVEREEVTWQWRKLHNEELNDLYCSPNIVLVIKWRRTRWVGHVARMGGRGEVIQGFGGETSRKETTWKTES